MSDVELTISAQAGAALKEVTGFRREFARLLKDAEKPIRQVNAFRELESALGQTGRQILDARDRIRELGTALAGAAQPTKEMTAEYRQAIRELKALERQEQAQIGQLGAMRRQMQAAGIDTGNLVTEQQRLARALESAVGTARTSQAAVLQREAEAAAEAARENEKLAAQRALGVGTIERTQRQLVELRQQYRLVTSDGALSAKGRAEAEANYRASVASTLAELRSLRAGIGESGQAMRRADLSVAQHGQVMQLAGLSAGQYNQAMRLLPMQLTDVATSLASGMPLWMVAIQQGGQIADSFGGIGNMLDLLGNKIGGLAGGAANRSISFISALAGGTEAAAAAQSALASGAQQAAEAVQDNSGSLADAAGAANDLAEAGERANAALAAAPPTTTSALAIAAGVTAAVAALTALVVAYRQGAAEAEAFEQALILNGNAAGTSADQLAGMARRVGEVNGTVGNAAAVLAEVAGTGKFAATQIEAIAAAAVAMEDATGRAVADTVAEFAKLAESPVAASVKLDQQCNYLTASVYKQIRALEEQGDTQAAQQLATDTYAAVVQERAEQIVESLGALESAWRAVGDGAAWAWDRMRDIGRQATDVEKLVGAYEELERLQKMRGPAAGGYDRLGAAKARVAELQQQIAESQTRLLEESQQNRIKDAGIKAEQQLEKALTATASAAEKRAKALKDIDKWAAEAAAAGLPFAEDELQKLRDAAIKQYQSEADRYADNLRRQIELQGEASEAVKVRYAIKRGELGELNAARKQALIADAELLDATNEYLKARAAAERKASGDLDAALKAQLETRKRYADALAGMQGGGDASYGAAQALKVRASEALARGDIEGAKLNAQAALKMLQDLAQAGENTFGFEGFIRSLQQIEESADQINVDNAKQALADIKQKGDELKALLDSIKTTTITVEMDGAALAKVRREILELAKLAGNPAELSGAAPSQPPQEGYAAGGYTGPGGKWQPAGVVHAGEHVQPQEVVREPGALAFLERIRRNGYQATMAQLSRSLRGYATGGLVAPRAMPSIPSLSPELAAAAHGPQSIGTLNFNLPGGESFGVTVVGDQWADLHKAALKYGRTTRRG